MNHVRYPTDPPFECVTAMFRMLRDGTARTEPAVFAKHLYEVVGYGLFIVLGDPDNLIVGENAAEKEAFVKTVMSEVAQTEGIPWPLILTAVIQILQLFKKKG